MCSNERFVAAGISNGPEAADKLQLALETVYCQKTMLTRDVGGSAGTKAFADAVIAALQKA